MGNNQVVGSVQRVSESTFEWTLLNSEKLVEGGFRWRDSPAFEYDDNTWTFQVNPYLDGSAFLCFCLRLDSKSFRSVDQLYTMHLKYKETLFWTSPVVADTFTQDQRKGILFVHKRDFLKDVVIECSGNLFLYVQFDPKDLPPSNSSMLRSHLLSFFLPSFLKQKSSYRREKANTEGLQEKQIPKKKNKETQTKAIVEPNLNSKVREAEAWGELSKDFEKLLVTGEGSDFVLKAGDKDFAVHKAVLMARSAVFCRMLQQDMAETREGVFRMMDCSPDTAEKMLNYLYAGKVPEITEDNVVELHGIGDMYDLPMLVRRCRESMMDLLSRDNFCAIFVVAMNYADVDLVVVCRNFFRTNKKSVMQTESWKTFLEENSRVANDLILECLD